MGNFPAPTTWLFAAIISILRPFGKDLPSLRHPVVPSGPQTSGTASTGHLLRIRKSASPAGTRAHARAGMRDSRASAIP